MGLEGGQTDLPQNHQRIAPASAEGEASDRACRSIQPKAWREHHTDQLQRRRRIMPGCLLVVPPVSSSVLGRLPGGGVVEVEPAGAVEGFFGGAGGLPLGR